MPTPVQRASSGGGSVPPPEPPQGATATMAKTPFFLRRDAFERTLSAMDYFLEDSRGKSNSAPAYCQCGQRACAGSFKVHLGSTRVGAVGRAVSEGVRA